jgi:glycosyltransferase involved in cell wall biosynthesis
MSKPNILVVTTLYPNQVQFRHGIFVETRIKHLNKTGEVSLTVVAPVPWVPFRCRLFPHYSKLVGIPAYERRCDIDVYHPRYLVIPKVGMLLTPFFLALAIYLQIRHLRKQGARFDVLDAHYFYPDGVAGAIIAKLLNVPLTITARGTDINLIPNYSLPRKMIVWAGKVSSFNISVCSALKERMVQIGVAKDSIKVLRNGVDLELFVPLMRDDIRRLWNVNRKLLLSVGNLTELKGHDLIIQAMQFLPHYELFIVGGGELEHMLKALTQQLNAWDRVRFIGEVQQKQLVELYNCADALVLASSREGWANVLLEAMACGTPVAASNTGGSPEIVREPEAGVLFSERSVAGIVDAVNRLFSAYPDRRKTRQYAEKFSWQETTDGLVTLFNETISGAHN